MATNVDSSRSSSGFAVRFDVSDATGTSTFYAGKLADGGLGFADTLATAEVWPSAEIAGNFLRNGYGPALNAVGRVIRVIDGAEVVLEPAS